MAKAGIKNNNQNNPQKTTVTQNKPRKQKPRLRGKQSGINFRPGILTIVTHYQSIVKSLIPQFWCFKGKSNITIVFYLG